MSEQRYRVLERLEAGGMAEVFRAEAAGVEGFRKRVAIKRVLPHLAENKKFMSMFLDEARLGARLNHANIVSVLDIGASDNTFFIVMEFIEGANLKTIGEGLKNQQRTMPVPQALYIGIESSQALAYAHELTDDDGTPLGIVHRDVSPPNIMLSRRGEVKLTDFGLAKAATQLEKTDPGVVKGKFSYLSPEAALGEIVDARADIFALGIVIWELISGERLFSGKSDYETVQLVQKADVPPLHRIRSDIDPSLDKLLMKALAKRPQDRFKTAHEFADAIADYLFGRQLKVTKEDLANLVKSIAKSSQQDKMPPTYSRIDQLIQEELLRFTSLEDVSPGMRLGASGRSLAGSQPLTPADVQGSRSMPSTSFEDPKAWFAHDTDVASAIDGHMKTQQTRHRRPSYGWIENATPRNEANEAPIELAGLLEADSLPPRARISSAPPVFDNEKTQLAPSWGESVKSRIPPLKLPSQAWKFVLGAAVALLAVAGWILVRAF